jgi:hypothetical protein
MIFENHNVGINPPNTKIGALFTLCRVPTTHGKLQALIVTTRIPTFSNQEFWSKIPNWGKGRGQEDPLSFWTSRF